MRAATCKAAPIREWAGKLARSSLHARADSRLLACIQTSFRIFYRKEETDRESPNHVR
jgi:hypothetical protein